MLTLFAIPKAFEGHIRVIQRNAIQSWKLLDPKIEIMLFGNDAGTSETAKEFGIKHIPDVACNELGTPLLSDIFSKATTTAQHRIVCYVNCDIVLMSDFIMAVKSLSSNERFLMIGRRWNMDVYEPIEFHSSWEKEMRDRLVQSGQMQTEYAIDYFVFPQNIPLEMPSFALGRPYWDNWMIYRMRQLGIPVVDATPKVMIVHQNHPAKNVYKPGEGWTGPEAKQNLEMIGGRKNIFTLLDATHTLQNGRMKRAMTYEHLRRRIDTISLLHPHLSPLMAVAGGVMRVLGPAWRKIRRGFTNNEQKQ